MRFIKVLIIQLENNSFNMKRTGLHWKSSSGNNKYNNISVTSDRNSERKYNISFVSTA